MTRYYFQSAKYVGYSCRWLLSLRTWGADKYTQTRHARCPERLRSGVWQNAAEACVTSGQHRASREHHLPTLLIIGPSACYTCLRRAGMQAAAPSSACASSLQPQQAPSRRQRHPPPLQRGLSRHPTLQCSHSFKECSSLRRGGRRGERGSVGWPLTQSGFRKYSPVDRATCRTTPLASLKTLTGGPRWRHTCLVSHSPSQTPSHSERLALPRRGQCEIQCFANSGGHHMLHSIRHACALHVVSLHARAPESVPDSARSPHS